MAAILEPTDYAVLPAVLGGAKRVTRGDPLWDSAECQRVRFHADYGDRIAVTGPLGDGVWIYRDRGDLRAY